MIEGTAWQEGLSVGGPRRARRYGPGESFSFPGSGVHRMNDDAGAVTIHVYSPPLQATGRYELIDGGPHRTPGPPDEGSPASPQLLDALDAIGR
ncbi:hypothetical protein [Streptomyces sp. NPDC003635]